MSNPIELIIVLAVLVVAIAIHECSHALVARLLGDHTAERMGRLTLNPLRHLDPMGSMMILISALSGFGIGWGKPTPVNPWNLRPRGRTGMALVAAGGPLSNFILAALLTGVLRLMPFLVGSLGLPLGIASVVWQVASIAAAVNLGLTAFNLLPLPMLDGFHIVMGLIASIKARWAYNLSESLARVEPHGPMILLVLILAGSFLRPSPISLMLVPIRAVLLRILGLG